MAGAIELIHLNKIYNQEKTYIQKKKYIITRIYITDYIFCKQYCLLLRKLESFMKNKMRTDFCKKLLTQKYFRDNIDCTKARVFVKGGVHSENLLPGIKRKE